MQLPLISCVMPTYGRPDYVAESIAMFQAQDYPNKELIILNDCPGQILRGDIPCVKIVNSESRWHSLGEKRNAAIEMATGDYIAVWDDDDVYLPWRLSHSLQHMQETSIPFYCPAEFWAYWGEEKLIDNHATEGWCCHPGMMFSKELWASTGGYPAQTLGEDQIFLTKAIEYMGIQWPRDRIAKSNRFLVMRCHSKYIHTSIQGGMQGPDASPRDIQLQPSSIDDNVLRSASEVLIGERSYWCQRQEIIRDRLVGWPGLPKETQRHWLDQFVPVSHEVGFAGLGMRGDLGYEGKQVEVCGVCFPHAISAHANSRLKYVLDGSFTHFCCQVALNDDIPSDASTADYLVYADGHLRGVARNVGAGQLPRMLMADVRGAIELELVIQHHRWDFCHSVWCDPFLVSISQESFTDGLGRAEITIPQSIPASNLCIATVGSPGYEGWIDNLFGSIKANGQCPEAMLAVFSFGDSEEIRQVAQKHNAIIIPCRPLKPLTCASKSVLYSAWRSIPARNFICLDADMIVLDDLRPVVSAIETSPPGSVHICREAQWANNISQAIKDLYVGHPHELEQLLTKLDPPESEYPLVVNDGFFAASNAALASIDSTIRGFSGHIAWVDDVRSHCPWRNQFIFNLAIAQTKSGLELHSRYNVQLNVQKASFHETESGLHATMFSGSRAAVVHFNGRSREYHSEWQGIYRDAQSPAISIDSRSSS